MNLNFARHIFHSARNVLRKLKIGERVPDSEWAQICFEGAIDPDTVSLDRSGHLLLKMERNLIRFPKTQSAYRLLSGYSLLKDLECATDCQLGWDDEKDSLTIIWGDVTYLADNSEEIFILSEIYTKGDYDYASSMAAPTVIVDIGANVGYTAIFLASANSNCLIEACEPMASSYEKALSNVAANPKLANRIALHNFGLSSQAGEFQMMSNPNNRGCSSLIAERPSDLYEKFVVTVQRASTFVKEVIERHPTRKIFIKMDCEGSEYEILRDLEQDGVLEKISGFMMEWHKVSGSNGNANYLQNFFTQARFDSVILGRHHSTASIGMAYAFRTAISISTPEQRCSTDGQVTCTA